MKARYRGIILLFLFFVACMGTSFYFSRYKLVVYPVEGSSMESTVHDGDKVIVYKTKNIKRGDIVVFNSERYEKCLIKRVIGLEGDIIGIRYNNETNAYDVYRNNELLEEDYLDKPMQNTYYEMEVEVPKGKMFFLGDNRNVSMDSHTSEVMEDITHIVGKVFFRYNNKSIGFLEIAA